MRPSIVVVAFDNNVTADCAYNVSWDFKTPAAAAAELARHSRSAAMATSWSTPGWPVRRSRPTSWREWSPRWRTTRGVEVVAQYAGEFAAGPSAQAFASIVATQPQIDAVFTQGYCDVVIEALQQANRPLVPMYCQGFNGNFVACTTTDDASCIASPSSPGISAIALRVALDVLEGREVDKNTVIDLPLYATDTSIDIGTEYGDMADVALRGSRVRPHAASGSSRFRG